jgi:hypothetical protein
VIYRLEEWRGCVVILNFWSAECPWAERSSREIQSWLPDMGGQVSLWNIASNDSEPPEMLRFAAQQQGLPFVLYDEAHRVADLYRAQTTPHCFLIDAQGVLRYQGALDDVTFRQRTPTRLYLHQAVEAVLAGQPPDPAQTAPYGCVIVRFEF